MSIEIPISGFPEELSTIRNGDIILFETGEDMIPTFLAQTLGFQYVKHGGKVLYITSRSESDINNQLMKLDSKGLPFEIYEKVDPFKFIKAFSPGSMIIIDSLSYLISNLKQDDLIEIFESMNEQCKKVGSILLLVGNLKIFDEASRIIIRHNCDGIYQFLYNERSEGINRFIRIPRWTDGRPYDINIFYNYQNERINIDLRSRVV
jgi:hypothetical protein